MKLNLGCGRRVLPGFYNIDIQPSPKAKRPLDMQADIRAVPLPDGCADELHAYHVIEHFARYEADALLAEWKRLLRPGGLLVLECPNIELCCRNLLAGKSDQMSMWGLYGDWNHRNPFMLHKHGYTPATISALVADCGFTHIKTLPPLTHSARADRDMRLEARK